jgi:HEAT repeat protein
VKGRHWVKFALVCAVTAALPPVLSSAQPTAAADVTRNDLEQQRATLTAPPSEQVKQGDRDEAARRLLQGGEIGVLQQALRGDRPEAQLAVAKALAETETPPPQLVDDLAVRLQSSISPDMAGAVAAALTNYKDDRFARDRLRSFILSVNVGERSRAAAAKALGRLTDKDTAQFLVERLLRSDSTPISDTAADALVDMTGQVEIGRDVGQWERWWQLQRNKTAEQFRSERLEDRDAAMRAAAGRYPELVAQIEKFAIETFGKITEPKDRDAYVLQNLKNPQPEFRKAGAALVLSKFNNGEPIGKPIVDQLRGMISDSSPDVRKAVAGVIRVINDPGAAPMLLAQLQRERVSSVKEKLIEALAPSGDVSAVPLLINLLDDPSATVAESAARALAELGPELAKNTDLMGKTSTALLQALRRTTINPRGTSRLRERLAEAMIPLRDPALAQPIIRELLPDREPNTANVRVAAIKALANIKDVDGQWDIAGKIQGSLLNDGSATVRREAAKALGTVGTPGQAETLSNAMDPNREADASVREAAWNSLSTLFAQFDTNMLTMWKDRFADPEKRLSLRLTLNKKLVALGATKAEELALIQEEIGTLYLNHLNKPDESIAYLLGALQYWDSAGGGFKTDNIQSNIMAAYLRTRKYKDAIGFATSRIQLDPSARQTMGRAVYLEADRLEKAKLYTEAAALLNEAKALPIEGRYRLDFEEMQSRIKEKIGSLHDLFPRLPREIYA